MESKGRHKKGKSKDQQQVQHGRCVMSYRRNVIAVVGKQDDSVSLFSPQSECFRLDYHEGLTETDHKKRTEKIIASLPFTATLPPVTYGESQRTTYLARFDLIQAHGDTEMVDFFWSESVRNGRRV